MHACNIAQDMVDSVLSSDRYLYSHHPDLKQRVTMLVLRVPNYRYHVPFSILLLVLSNMNIGSFLVFHLSYALFDRAS